MRDERPYIPPEDSEAFEERWQRSRRQHRAHVMTTFLLVLVVAGLAWFGYTMLRRHEASLKNLSGNDVPTLRHAVGALGEQVKEGAQSVDQKIAQWTLHQAVDHRSLREQTADAARDLRARIEVAGQQAHESAESTIRQVRAEVGEKVDAVTNRVATIESSHASDQKQIAALQQQLGDMQRQVTEQATALATVRNQIQQSGTSAQERIAALQQDQESTRQDVGAIEGKLSVDRIPFEATTGQAQDLVNGISLYVSATDAPDRRTSGWLWVMPDQRNISLRNLAAQEPLTFYGYKDGRKRELVITNVSTTGVTGYLLVPKESAEAAHKNASE